MPRADAEQAEPPARAQSAVVLLRVLDAAVCILALSSAVDVPASAAAAQLDVGALTRACDDGDAAACVELADAFETGAGVPHRNLVRSRDLYERACLLGDALACAQLETASEIDPSPAGSDPEAALGTYRKRCDAGDAAMCVRAGVLEANARRRTAEAFFERGCALGDPHGCFSYAMNVMRSDAREALPLFARACTGKVKRACIALAGVCERARLRHAPECVAPKEKTGVDVTDMRAHAVLSSSSYSVVIPDRLRVPDVIADARLNRLSFDAFLLDVERATFLVPQRDDLGLPVTFLGRSKLALKNGSSDVASCKRAGVRGFHSVRVMRSAFGDGCLFRFVVEWRTRAETRLFLVKVSEAETLAVVVAAESAPGEDLIEALVETLRRDSDEPAETTTLLEPPAPLEPKPVEHPRSEQVPRVEHAPVEAAADAELDGVITATVGALMGATAGMAAAVMIAVLLQPDVDVGTAIALGSFAIPLLAGLGGAIGGTRGDPPVIDSNAGFGAALGSIAGGLVGGGLPFLGLLFFPPSDGLEPLDEARILAVPIGAVSGVLAGSAVGAILGGAKSE